MRRLNVPMGFVSCSGSLYGLLLERRFEPLVTWFGPQQGVWFVLCWAGVLFEVFALLEVVVNFW